MTINAPAFASWPGAGIGRVEKAMQWKAKRLTRQEALEIIEKYDPPFWGLELDANGHERDRIAPVIVALYIPAYEHLAYDQARRENWFMENLLRRAKEIDARGNMTLYVKKKEPYKDGKIKTDT